VPVLVKVTAWAALVVPTCWLVKVRLVGVRFTAGATPVPVKLAVCGLPLALSETVMAPVRVPTVVGVKVTLIVQLAAAASEVPQLFVCA
jgi:hypothetical protein